jgi:hypothetical protein
VLEQPVPVAEVPPWRRPLLAQVEKQAQPVPCRRKHARPRIEGQRSKVFVGSKGAEARGRRDELNICYGNFPRRGAASSRARLCLRSTRVWLPCLSQVASAYPPELRPCHVGALTHLTIRKGSYNAMPRYFFDVRETGNLAVDDEGIELLDIEAAHQAAARCLLDMARDGISADPFRHNMAIEFATSSGPFFRPSSLSRWIGQQARADTAVLRARGQRKCGSSLHSVAADLAFQAWT